MIISRGELPQIKPGAGGQRVGLRLGCFDIFHDGHMEGIKFAAEQCDILVVGVGSDERVKRLKGPDRPIEKEAKRIDVVSGIEEVDYVFAMPSPRAAWFHVMLNLQPDVFVEGSEHCPNPLRANFLRLMGIDYAIDHGEKINSTTAIIASRMIGHEA